MTGPKTYNWEPVPHPPHWQGRMPELYSVLFLFDPPLGPEGYDSYISGFESEMQARAALLEYRRTGTWEIDEEQQLIKPWVAGVHVGPSKLLEAMQDKGLVVDPKA